MHIKILKYYFIFLFCIYTVLVTALMFYSSKKSLESKKEIKVVLEKPIIKEPVKFPKLEADGLYQGKYVPVELYNAMVQEHASKEQYIKASLEVTLDNSRELKKKIEELEESVRILRDASGYDGP